MKYILLIMILVVGCYRASDEIKSEYRAIGIQMGTIPRLYVSKYKISPLSSIYVRKVDIDSPSMKSGVIEGDVIFAVNNTDVDSMTMFRELIKGKSEITLSIWRNGSVVTLQCNPVFPKTELSPLDSKLEFEIRTKDFNDYADRKELIILSVKRSG